MAEKEGKSSKVFKKFVQNTGRAKEKILQSVGKAEKTTDETFDQYVINFRKQQNTATKLHKELKNYILCAKNMQYASQSLFEVMEETYDPTWYGHDRLRGAAEQMNLLWADYSEKLQNQVLQPLQSYETQFPDIKAKVEKRSRKLLDFDGKRHNVEALRQAKKKDDPKELAKIVKSQDEMNEAKKVYEEIHSELMDELPALWDSRVSFTVSNFQTLCSAEASFHGEATKVNQELSSVLDGLAEESAKGTYSVRRSSSSCSDTRQNSDSAANGQPPSATPATTVPAVTTTAAPPSQEEQPPQEDTSSASDGEGDREAKDERYLTLRSEDEPETFVTPTSTLSGGMSARRRTESGEKTSAPAETPAPVDNHEDAAPGVNGGEPKNPFEEDGDDEAAGGAGADGDKKVQEAKETTAAPSTDAVEAPASTLYKVKASHSYGGEDEDELTFESGDIIFVVPYDDPEEQDEGWLMGIKAKDGNKGVFPANFTKPFKE